MRILSIFPALLLAPLTLPAQESMQYAPPHPTQTCPVFMAVHRVGGLAAVRTGTPAATDEEKQLRTHILDLRQQISTLKSQKADLQEKLRQNPETSAYAELRHQLTEIDALLNEKEVEAAQLTIKLGHEQAQRIAAEGYMPPQGLDLNIAGEDLKPIASIDILVHGFTNRGQIIPGSQDPNAVPSVQNRYRSGSGQPIAPTQSFHLTRHGSEASIRTSIVARGMIGISWLDVTHVEFEDGSAWAPTARDVCHFAPSLYVPVDFTAR